MVDAKLIKEYAADMALYYESAHGFVPAQFEKYLRKAVRKGVELMADVYEELRKVTAQRTAELEKENEELRKVAEHQQTTSMDRYFRSKALDENLITAKSLIRKLIDSCCAYGATGRTTADAEQFLREAM